MDAKDFIRIVDGRILFDVDVNGEWLEELSNLHSVLEDAAVFGKAEIEAEAIKALDKLYPGFGDQLRTRYYELKAELDAANSAEAQAATAAEDAAAAPAVAQPLINPELYAAYLKHYAACQNLPNAKADPQAFKLALAALNQAAIEVRDRFEEAQAPATQPASSELAESAMSALSASEAPSATEGGLPVTLTGEASVSASASAVDGE